MFTGIIEEIGTVQEVRNQNSVRTLVITAEKILEDMHIGDSISVNGACLTVIDFDDQTFSVQVIKGTENKTYLSDVQRHTKVNLERAMSGNGRFGGHFVLGHVDDLGTISKINESANSMIIQIKASKTLLNQMVKQGSITVDGTSLTIFDLHSDAFDIHLIPETRRSTILSSKKVGDNVHLESDVLFKYVENILNQNQSSLTEEKLKAFGF
ncbi:riboflavin synthase [Staphylococcus warneri]|jgi:riboflavin synthase|uniref:Riboflavin synthase n=1 Tax=Staphylococcus warneri TaxID=1292 RepID=A0A2T4Q1W4_STAWA|nr:MULTISPECIES: riboflavin synthase [Staphylococcus]MBE9428189.1 riboflavin synthase [Staphylococcus epidermidis]AXV42087.1 riboflavin synthase subunit alpha [Staphylococcus sp. M0911]EEQ79009.1 riboflavin synthase, alpha subunit [Staphylococcus warneri L37603]MBO0377694.1 riboflavin synthase [Staphylococcus warneri]MCD8803166.1 riboflavin synthase [Staphylococcus warneri]